MSDDELAEIRRDMDKLAIAMAKFSELAADAKVVAAQAATTQQIHEAVCAERYRGILETSNAMTKAIEVANKGITRLSYMMAAATGGGMVITFFLKVWM
jgi:ribonucleotide reductase beta subunit family protein with ferritin-like domain